MIASAGSQFASGATTQLIASVENSKFLGGANLTDDSLAVSLNADWTFDKGSFAGVDCYVSSVDVARALDKGCDFYAGFFTPLNDGNALSIRTTRHEYSRGLGRKWDFTDLSLSWHPSKTSRFTATYSNKWLRRSFDSFALNATTKLVLSERVSLNLSGGVNAFESGAPVNALINARAALSYTRARWTGEIGVIYTDSKQRRVLPFDIDEPELIFNLRYRLY